MFTYSVLAYANVSMLLLIHELAHSELAWYLDTELCIVDVS